MEEKKELNEELLVKIVGGAEWPSKVECVWCRFTFDVPPNQEIVTCPKCGRKLHISY